MNSDLALPLLRQWNSGHTAQYQIRFCDLKWNLEKQSLLKYQLAPVAGVSCLVASATPAGVAFGISKKNLFLSLWGQISPGKNIQFVGELIKLSRQLKKEKLFFGADEFHFLPGIPETDQMLILAVQESGFETSRVADFTGSLNTTLVDHYVQDSLASAESKKLTLRNLETAFDHEVLSTFLEKEFPGRWPREFKSWRKRTDTQRAWWMILYQNKKDIVGFARLSHRGRSLDTMAWTPAALRLPIAENNTWDKSDGALGPIGVAQSSRGQGSGKILLGLVLQALRQNQVDRICIDWTNAFKYYEPLGFLQSRNYVSSWRNEFK